MAGRACVRSRFPGFILYALAAMLSACAVGPDYTRPAMDVPAAFKEAPDGWKAAQPADQLDRGAWWTIYDDVQLSALEDELNQSNQTIAQFAAAHRGALALVAEARSAYFPTVGFKTAASRAQPPSGRVSQSYNLSINASWEPDFWSSVSRTVAGQQAGQQAAAADFANARLSVQATLAQAYFQLRAFDALRTLLDSTVVAFQRSLQLTQNRYAQGIVARSDVIQAQTQLQSVQAAAIDNGVARAQSEHAIAVLLGRPASIFSIPRSPLDATPPAVPAEMPSAILERRPDIASAERRAAAANEKIGVAIAAFFPTLTVSATGGFRASLISELLRAPSHFWSLGPNLAAQIFDGGLRIAQAEAARATYDQTVATYRLTVLAAFEDVEDNLASLRILEHESAVQQQAVESARHALTIVTNQYKAGTVGYLNVLVAQASALMAEQRLSTIAGQRMVSSVGLVKALGGGWTAMGLNRERDATATSYVTDH